MEWLDGKEIEQFLYRTLAQDPNRQFFAVLKEDDVSIYSQSGSKIGGVNDFLRNQHNQKWPYYERGWMVPAGPIAWLDNKRIVVGNDIETAHSPDEVPLSIIDIKSKTVKAFMGYMGFSISHDKN